MTLEITRTKPENNIASTSSFSAEKTVETIKNVSENIRAYSVLVRETTKTIHESGVIPELAGAIYEAASAVRDTVTYIRETAKDLKQSGAIDDTARAVKETRKAALDTIHTVKTSGNIRHQTK